MTDSDIIAASSVVVAVASLAVSLASVWWSRVSSIRSMRPMLIGSNHREITNNGRTYIYEFAIESVGAGPAMLRDVRLYFKEELFTGTGFYRDRPADLIHKCFPVGVWPNAKPCSQVVIEKNGMPSCKGALRPGDCFVFARIRFDSDLALSEDAVRKLEALFDQADYQVDYTSIYGEETWTCRP